MNGYVDIHSHVLPFLDDGAEDMKTAVEIVKECIKQGITTIICTPHYLHNREESVNDFIKRRDESYRLLKNELEKQGITNIDFRLAAEVNFNCDLSEVENIEKLAIEGTDYILIEMPGAAWQDGMFDYLYTLIAKKNLIPIIAHVERYYQNEREFQKLEKLQVYFQVNAPAFLDKADKKNADKLLKDRKVHLIGTDVHNLSNRSVKMKKGLSYIEKKTSAEYLQYLIGNGFNVINNEEIEDVGFDYGYYEKESFFGFLKNFRK